MSAFQQCFLFLRNPNGGVEDLARMKAAGFGGVFCNIRDYPVEAWEDVIVPRAQEQGMFCGPWARTNDENNNFDPDVLDAIIYCADDWHSPLVVNSESEVKASGSEITKEIAAAIGARDGAVSMEPWPFADVDWTPLRDIPVLPQIFTDYADAATRPYDCKAGWHEYGVKCVYFTFGSYGTQEPDHYDLKAPYSIYTGDDCGYDYAAWSPTSTGYVGCVDQPTPIPPTNGDDDMQKIGSQHGVTAAVNRLRTNDPEGTLLVPDAKGKWPPLETIAGTSMDRWKAYDKLERSLLILVQDHDEQMDIF
jgi:hypothetical protein